MESSRRRLVVSAPVPHSARSPGLPSAVPYLPGYSLASPANVCNEELCLVLLALLGLMNFPFWLNPTFLSGWPFLQVSAKPHSSTWLSSHSNLPAVAPRAGQLVFISATSLFPQDIRNLWINSISQSLMTLFLSVTKTSLHVYPAVIVHKYISADLTLWLSLNHRGLHPPSPGLGSQGKQVM